MPRIGNSVQMVSNNRKWCNRCNKYHNSLPLDEKKTLTSVKKLIEKHASDIAREIDQEILNKIRVQR